MIHKDHRYDDRVVMEMVENQLLKWHTLPYSFQYILTVTIE